MARPSLLGKSGKLTRGVTEACYTRYRVSILSDRQFFLTFPEFFSIFIIFFQCSVFKYSSIQITENVIPFSQGFPVLGGVIMMRLFQEELTIKRTKLT